MDLKNAMDSIKSGSATPNPITTSIDSLTAGISSLTNSVVIEIQELTVSLQEAMTAASTAATDMIASLATRLPLMKAADTIEAKMAVSQGAEVPTDGGNSFKAAFGALDAAKAHMASLQSALTPTILTQLQAGVTTGLAAVNTSVATASSNLTAGINAGISAQADSISNLKAFSFAKFCSMPQPPHVQKIINECTSLNINKELARADSIIPAKKLQQSPIVATPLASSSPYVAPLTDVTPALYRTNPSLDRVLAQQNLGYIGYTDPATYFTSFKSMYFNYVDTLSKEYDVLLAAQIAKKPAIDTWRTTTMPDYDKVREFANNNPNDSTAVAAYEANHQTMLQYQPWIDYNAYSKDVLEVKRLNLRRLIALFDKWIDTGFEGVTAGPTW